MKRKSLKTAAYLLIFCLLAALFPLSSLGESARHSALKKGDSGEEVASLQRELRALRLLDFKGEPSGVFTDEVERAVIALQHLLSVKADGIYGTNTRRAHIGAVEGGSLTPFYVEELPLYGCVIGIDAGHQQKADLSLEPIAPGSGMMRFSMSDGCVGVRTSIRESVINLEVSLILAELLEKLGADVVASREYEEVNLSNVQRAKLMNERHVDFWLRIHCDHSTDPSVYGARILVPNSIVNFNIASRSALLGSCIIRNYCETVGTELLLSRAMTGETGFNWSGVPVAALELGYLSNAASDIALSSPAFRRKCAEGIGCGIAEYYLASGRIDSNRYLEAFSTLRNQEPGEKADGLFALEFEKNLRGFGIFRLPLLASIK